MFSNGKASLNWLLIAIVLAICLPILCGLMQSPWLSFWQEWIAGLGWCCVGLICVWKQRINRSQFALKASAAGLAMISIFFLLTFLSLGWILVLMLHDVEYYSARWWLVYSVYTAMFVCLSFCLDANTKTEIIWAVSHGLVLASLIGCFQVIAQLTDFKELGTHLIDINPGGRPSSNLGQANLIGTLLLLGCISAIFLRTKQHLHKLPFSLTLTLLGFAIAATKSRTALVGCAIVAILAFITLKSRHESGKHPAYLAFWTVYVWLAAYLQLPDWLLNNYDTSVVSLTNRAFADRLSIYAKFISLAADKPLLGWGPGGALAAQFYSSSGVETQLPQLSRYGHNLILDLAVSFGIPAAIVISICGLFLWVKGFAGIRDATSLWAGSCVTVVILHSLLEFPFAYIFILMPTAILVTVWIQSCSGAGIYKFSFKYMFHAFTVTFMCVFVLLFQLAADYSAASEKFRAVKMNSFGFVDAYVKESRDNKHVVKLLPEFESLNSLLALSPKTVLSNSQLDKAEIVTSLNPYPFVIMKYSQLLVAAGYRDEAILMMNKIGTLWPGKAKEQAVDYWSKDSSAPPIPEDLLRK